MNQEQQKFLHEWALKADEDMVVIERLSEGSIVAITTIGFHCQQLAEKYLKLFLLANNCEITKTHNIEFLLNECCEIDNSFASIDPKNLTDFSVQLRYPGFDFIPSESEIIEYIELAKEIRQHVLQKINF